MAKIITRFTNKGIVETVVGNGSVTSSEIEGFPTPKYYVGEGGFETIQEAIDAAIANAATVPPVVFVSPGERTEDLVIENVFGLVIEFLGGRRGSPNDLSWTPSNRLIGSIRVRTNGVITSCRLDILGSNLLSQSIHALSFVG